MKEVAGEGVTTGAAIDPLPRRREFRRIRQVLIIGLILVLSAINVATIVSDTAHEFALDALRGVIAAFSDATASRIIASSTTSKINRAVAERTAALSREVTEVERKHKATLDALNERHRLLMSKHANLERAHLDLGTKYSALEKTHVELKGKHAELSQVSARRAKAVKTFSKSLGERTVKNVSRNVTSVPGEAIPYLGTALLVGVTSWDIYDACQTIKELNVVNLEFANEAADDQRVCGMKVPTQEEVVAQIQGNWREAYASAAVALSEAGERIPRTLPTPSWKDLKNTVCPVIGSPRIVCD